MSRTSERDHDTRHRFRGNRRGLSIIGRVESTDEPELIGGIRCLWCRVRRVILRILGEVERWGATERDNSSEAVPCVLESEFEQASLVEASPGPDRGSDSAPEEPTILEDAPELPGDEPGLSRKPMATLSAAEALERLRRGEPLQNVRIERLVLKGEFPLPVRLTHVMLVHPRLERARFLDEVEMGACTLDRLRTAGRSTFAKGWDLRVRPSSTRSSDR